LIGMVLGVFVGVALQQWTREASLVTAPAAGSLAASLYGSGEFSFVPYEGVPVMLAAALDVAGQLFIKLLKMVIIPLIIATMISGVLSLGSFRKLGRMGLRTFLYYFFTTAVSVSIGLVAVNLIEPGVGADIGGGRVIEQFEEGTKGWGDLVLSLVPDNPVEAMANMDVLPVIVFSLLLGAVLLSLGDEAGPLPGLFEAFARAMMRMTEWVIRLAPYGVFALMATVVLDFGWETLASLAVYMATVVAGLAVHFFIALPLIAWIVGGYSPVRLLKDVSSAVIMAFSSASSSATLPLTMENLQENTGLSSRVTSFVLPIGATVNMDGTALYEAIAVVFIAQAYGIELSLAQQLLIFVTATMAAIGAAAIPSAGLFTMAIVLKAVGLPLEGVALIIGVDRILDMMRTATNVWGDAVGTLVIARTEGDRPGKAKDEAGR